MGEVNFVPCVKCGQAVGVAHPHCRNCGAQQFAVRRWGRRKTYLVIAALGVTGAVLTGLRIVRQYNSSVRAFNGYLDQDRVDHAFYCAPGADGVCASDAAECEALSGAPTGACRRDTHAYCFDFHERDDQTSYRTCFVSSSACEDARTKRATNGASVQGECFRKVLRGSPDDLQIQ